MTTPANISRLIDEWTPIELAFARAAAAARREHKLLGQPMPIWRDGRVVWLQPDEIEIADPDEPGISLSAAG